MLLLKPMKECRVYDLFLLERCSKIILEFLALDLRGIRWWFVILPCSITTSNSDVVARGSKFHTFSFNFLLLLTHENFLKVCLVVHTLSYFS